MGSLAIVCDASDMAKVLRGFADNLVANRTAFSPADIDDISSPTELWPFVKPYIGYFSDLAFTDMPVSNKESHQSRLWPSLLHLNDGDYYAFVLKAGHPLAKPQEGWCSYLAGLCANDYGVSTIELKGSGSAVVEAGTSCGPGEKTPRIFSHSYHPYDITLAHMPTTGPLGLACNLSCYVFNKPEPLKDCISVAGSQWTVVSVKTQSWKPEAIAPVQVADVMETLGTILPKFPIVECVTGFAYEGREQNVEQMHEGEPLGIVSNWKSKYFKPVALEVYTSQGLPIGNLGLQNGMPYGKSLGFRERTAIACILNHVHAYAEKVDPLSKRGKRAKHSTVKIRLECDTSEAEVLEPEVRALLELGTADRILFSTPQYGKPTTAAHC